MKKLSTLLLCLMMTHFAFAHPDDTSRKENNTTTTVLTNPANNTVSQNTSHPHITPTSPTPNHAFTDVDTVKAHAKELYTNSLLNKQHWDGNDKWQFYSSLVVLLAILVGGFLLAKNSSMCKDETYRVDGKLEEKTNAPYSYSRLQLFWWTIIVLSTYTMFFGLTGYLLPLNYTTVILLGMGIVVLASGKLIDNREITDEKIPFGSRTQDQKEKNSNFIFDILSDEKGISIHRFQAVAFNVAFGIGFLGYFFRSFSNHRYPFPDYSEGVFALLGISATAYLGLKASENKTATGATQSTNNQSSNSNSQTPDSSNQIPNSSNQIPNSNNQIPNSNNQIPNSSNQTPDPANQSENISVSAINGFKALEKDDPKQAVIEFNKSALPHSAIGNTVQEVGGVLDNIDAEGMKKVIKAVLDNHRSIIPHVFQKDLDGKI